MKNILIVSEDFYTELGNKMWKVNTNYTLIKCTDFKDYDFRKYIEDHPSIVLTREKDFTNETPKTMTKFLKEYNIRLILFRLKDGNTIIKIMGDYLTPLYDDIQIVTEPILGREDEDICIRQMMNND